MADELNQGTDLLKLIGVILGGYGALLSTYNFFTSHYGRLIVEFTRDHTDDAAGRLRVLCLGRPRFVDEIIIRDEDGNIVLAVDVGRTLSRGESYRTALSSRAFGSEKKYQAKVISEQKEITLDFATK
ncbi:MAG: hypothetical protein ABJC91_13970 [Lentilitoribacter sp.]